MGQLTSVFISADYDDRPRMLHVASVANTTSHMCTLSMHATEMNRVIL